MSVKCGIVGLPNVGKSTLFNALTEAGIAAENFPFCTIEPNSGIVSIPDTRLDKLAELVKPEKLIPTTVEFTDIAGWWRGPPRAKDLATNSSPTSGNAMPSPMWCAVSKMKMSPMCQYN